MPTRNLYDVDVTIPPHMPQGAIVLVTGDCPRYHEFFVSLLHTMAIGVPMGTSLKWNRGLNLCPSLNDAVQRALDEGAQWLWFLGDDHTWSPALLTALWRHELPVIAPLVRRRAAPFDTVMFRDGERLVLPDGTRGLVEVDAVGSAGLLVRADVMRALGPKPFEIGDPYTQNEDVTFCHKIRRAGWRIYVDTDQGMGHLTTVEIWPARTAEGKHVHHLISSLTMQLL